MRYRRDVVLKDGSACLLRSAEASDARECFDVFQVTHAETDYLLSYPDENSLDEGKFADELGGRAESLRCVEVCAVVGGKIVGTASVDPIGRRFKNRHRCELGISILCAYWGRGIGRALMEACLECARQMGYVQAELEVVADNTSAIGLYRSLGFVEFGRNPLAFRSRTSGWQEVVLMRLEL